MSRGREVFEGNTVRKRGQVALGQGLSDVAFQAARIANQAIDISPVVNPVMQTAEQLINIQAANAAKAKAKADKINSAKALSDYQIERTKWLEQNQSNLKDDAQGFTSSSFKGLEEFNNQFNQNYNGNVLENLQAYQVGERAGMYQGFTREEAKTRVNYHIGQASDTVNNYQNLVYRNPEFLVDAMNNSSLAIDGIAEKGLSPEKAKEMKDAALQGLVHSYITGKSGSIIEKGVAGTIDSVAVLEEFGALDQELASGKFDSIFTASQLEQEEQVLASKIDHYKTQLNKQKKEFVRSQTEQFKFNEDNWLAEIEQFGGEATSAMASLQEGIAFYQANGEEIEAARLAEKLNIARETNTVKLAIDGMAPEAARMYIENNFKPEAGDSGFKGKQALYENSLKLLDSSRNSYLKDPVKASMNNQIVKQTFQSGNKQSGFNLLYADQKRNGIPDSQISLIDKEQASNLGAMFKSTNPQDVQTAFMAVEQFAGDSKLPNGELAGQALMRQLVRDKKIKVADLMLYDYKDDSFFSDLLEANRLSAKELSSVSGAKHSEIRAELQNEFTELFRGNFLPDTQYQAAFLDVSSKYAMLLMKNGSSQKEAIQTVRQKMFEDKTTIVEGKSWGQSNGLIIPNQIGGQPVNQQALTQLVDRKIKDLKQNPNKYIGNFSGAFQFEPVPVEKLSKNSQKIYKEYSPVAVSGIAEAASTKGLSKGETEMLQQIFLRQINQESGWQTQVGSQAGAKGIAQIIPETAVSWGLVRNPSEWTKEKAASMSKESLEAGSKNMVSYYSTYKKQGHEPWKAAQLALAAYNAGPGAVQKYGDIPPYKETQDYVKRIMGNKPKSFSPLSSSLKAGRYEIQLDSSRTKLNIVGKGKQDFYTGVSIPLKDAIGKNVSQSGMQFAYNDAATDVIKKHKALKEMSKTPIGGAFGSGF